MSDVDANGDLAQGDRSWAMLCVCGRWLYDHTSIAELHAGGRTYGGCAASGCEKFRNEYGEVFVTGQLRADLELTPAAARPPADAPVRRPGRPGDRARRGRAHRKSTTT